jgi:hypothetical protein
MERGAKGTMATGETGRGIGGLASCIRRSGFFLAKDLVESSSTSSFCSSIITLASCTFETLTLDIDASIPLVLFWCRASVMAPGEPYAGGGRWCPPEPPCWLAATWGAPL